MRAVESAAAASVAQGPPAEAQWGPAARQSFLQPIRRLDVIAAAPDKISVATAHAATLERTDEAFRPTRLEAAQIGLLYGSPEGRAFVETMGFNPVLSTARRLLPGRLGIEKASTDDEAPLTPAAIRRFGEVFDGSVTVEWPAVVCVRMLCYVPFLRGPLASGLLRAADRGLGWLPGLGRASYFGVVALRRQG